MNEAAEGQVLSAPPVMTESPPTPSATDLEKTLSTPPTDRISTILANRHRDEDWQVSTRRQSEMYQAEVKRHNQALKDQGILQELLEAEVEGRAPSEEAQNYLEGGGSIAELEANWEEYENAEAPSMHKSTDVDKNLSKARRAYIKAAHKKDLPLRRTSEVDRVRQESEKDYINAVIAKVQSISETPVEQALQAGYMPEVIEKLSFGPDIERSIEDIVGNHMFILVDVLAREKILRDELGRKLANDKGLRKVLKSVRASDAYRTAVLATVFGAASLGMGGDYLPDAIQPIGDIADQGLTFLSAGLLSQGFAERLHGGVVNVAERRRHKKAQKKLAQDPKSADHVLSTAYSSYDHDEIASRHGTDDVEENLKRFSKIEPAFRDELIETAGGEKPYEGTDVLEYCERLYLTHRTEVEAIVQAPDPQRAYEDLVALFLREDLVQMQDNIRKNPLKQVIHKSVAVAGALVGDQVVFSADGARAAAQELAGMR